MQRSAVASVFLLAALVQPVLAQSATDHSAHHPDQNEAPASGAGKATGAATPSESMMGERRMKMMGSMPMSDMMQMMSGMGRPSDDGMDGLEMLDHVEGRIAFLRAELKITDAQTSAWSGFADALRARAKMQHDDGQHRLRDAARPSHCAGKMAVGPARRNTVAQDHPRQPRRDLF